MQFCPHCGYSLEREKPINRDGWNLTYHSARYNGSDFGLTAQQANVLYTLAQADGRWIKGEVLGSRISSSEYYRANITAIQVHRIRKKVGDGTPIEARRNFGYRWSIAA